MAEDFVLETHNLEKCFGGVHAIEGVNFRLTRGELRCLIGPNGAGKSTFFKMVTGQLSPSDGKIFFNGKDITKAQMYQISRLGIVIKNQVPDVFDGLTVRENIWLASRFAHSAAAAKSAVDEVMGRLNLTHHADRIVGELAHGQRQWVEFAVVLTLDPHLILLDEPTAGMSVEEVRLTADFIREANRRASIIVVEHDMLFIRQIASKVTVFHQGRILVEDTMENIQNNPQVREIYLGKSEHA